MTTETTETLRQKANEAVAAALGYSSYDCARVWSAWGQGTMGDEDFSLVSQNPDRVCEITEAALDAVGFDALMEEREALREALRWYGEQAKRMGKAALHHNKEVALEQMQIIGADFGKRARATLKE